MVNIPKIFKDDESESSTLLLPLLPLRDIVVFPHMVAPLFVGRTKSVNALTDAMNINPMFYFTELKGFEDQVVMHRWSFNGNVMAEVSFNVGGPRWRVYSSKRFQPEWDGDWIVEVVDQAGVVVATDSVAVQID